MEVVIGTRDHCRRARTAGRSPPPSIPNDLTSLTEACPLTSAKKHPYNRTKLVRLDDLTPWPTIYRKGPFLVTPCCFAMLGNIPAAIITLLRDSAVDADDGHRHGPRANAWKNLMSLGPSILGIIVGLCRSSSSKTACGCWLSGKCPEANADHARLLDQSCLSPASMFAGATAFGGGDHHHGGLSADPGYQRGSTKMFRPISDDRDLRGVGGRVCSFADASFRRWSRWGLVVNVGAENWFIRAAKAYLRTDPAAWPYRPLGSCPAGDCRIWRFARSIHAEAGAAGHADARRASILISAAARVTGTSLFYWQQMQF